MTAFYNVAVIGQTGVGKSSLINYVFGLSDDQRADTGAGRPVTEEGFHAYESEITTKENKHKIKVFDSWGLEVGKHKAWEKMFKKEMAVRGIDKAPEKWFHSVIYCISGSRVQDADINIIKIALDNQYPVSIAITKSDTLSQSEIQTIETVIREELKENGNKILIVPICSEEKELQGGHISKPFGKDDILSVIQKQIFKSIAIRLPSSFEKRTLKKLEIWRDDMRSHIRNKTGLINEKDIEKDISKYTEKIKKELLIEREKVLRSVFDVYKEGLNVTSLRADYKAFEESDGFYDDMGWGEKIASTALLTTLALPILIYFAITGKSSNKKVLEEALEKTVSSLKVWIGKETALLRERLNK